MTMTLLLASTLFTGDALAGRPAMDPQVRMHLGVSAVQGPSPIGLMGGLDSRLTRSLHVDIGGMGTLTPIPEGAEVEVEVDTDYYRLRHGIYLAPGVRIPHRQPSAFSWDVIFRFGGAVTWSADLDPEAVSLTTDRVRHAIGPAGLGGVDLMIRGEKVGVRASGKGFASWVYDPHSQDNALVISPQVGLEALYQF